MPPISRKPNKSRALITHVSRALRSLALHRSLRRSATEPAEWVARLLDGHCHASLLLLLWLERLLLELWLGVAVLGDGLHWREVRLLTVQ